MRNVVLLGLTSLLTDISSEMVYPLVPFFLTAVLGASPAMLGLIEGLAESAASLLKVFAGVISDRMRKRKGLIIAGYGAAALGKLLLALASGWGM
ncbi:MAG TPA: MFS transporter, partial [Methylomirabilota bacterium]